MAYLHCVVSLYSLPSSDGLAAREFAREVAGEAFFEPGVEGALDFALRETVLPLSSACLRRSCILSVLFLLV